MSLRNPLGRLMSESVASCWDYVKVFDGSMFHNGMESARGMLKTGFEWQLVALP